MNLLKKINQLIHLILIKEEVEHHQNQEFHQLEDYQK